MPLIERDYADTTEPTEADAARRHLAKRPPSTKQQQEGEDPSSEDSVAEEDEDFIEEVSMAIPQRYDAGPPSIYVVPRDLAEGTKDAYEPAAVCIGPYYGGTARERVHLSKLERYKWCCVRKLIVNAAAVGDAWDPEVHSPLLRRCLDTVSALEPRILASYGASGSISTEAIGGSRELAIIVLLDGCFLLHRLLKYARLATAGAGPDPDDDDDWTQVPGRYGVWGIVTRDLLLLKNQIPFFVLQTLLEQLQGHADDDDILIKGALRLFAPLRPGPQMDSSTIACHDVQHLLHLFYRSIGFVSTLPADSSNSSGPQQHEQALPLELQGWVPCAKELEEAGVKFQARNKKQQQQSFLDVSFRGGICGGGVLEIPPLQLYDSSEALFRNLIAFEQTYLDTPGHVTAYAIFMDCLIKTPEDMRLLHQNGVLVSHMNGVDRDVAMGLFSRVCAQAHTSPDRNYLYGMMADVVRYQRRRLPRWRAALKRDYFSNPWATIAFVAAFFALVMTVLQTFYAVYGYYKQKK